ncbi:hypothetical protein Sjap_017878 [Stephania japonica]|uniref:Uncharacterized protein n=1 Tax=Stephania japonica TaxID=461633 RepID=A0AAP0I750_9MAGN
MSHIPRPKINHSPPIPLHPHISTPLHLLSPPPPPPPPPHLPTPHQLVVQPPSPHCPTNVA